MRRARIGPFQLAPVSEQTTLLRTSTGKTFTLRATTEAVSRFVALLDGTHSDEEIASALDEGDSVLALLRAKGVVHDADPGTPDVWARTAHPDLRLDRVASAELVVAGDGPLTARIAEELARLGCRSVRSTGIAAQLDSTPGDHEVWVVVAEGDPVGSLERVNEVAEAHGVPWLPVRVELNRVYAGPAVVPGRTADFCDLVQRRRAAAKDQHVFDAAWTLGPEPSSLLDSEASWAASHIAVLLERWIAGAYRADISGSEIELDPVELTVEHHGVLPMPDRPRALPPRPTNAWLLRDPQTGIITSLRQHVLPAHLPRRLTLAVSDVCRMRRVLDWPNDPQAYGASWRSLQEAEGAAVGEAIERYCGNWLPPDRETVEGSYDEITRTGRRAVDPDSFALYSARQHAEPGFPFVPFTRQTRLAWIEGRSLRDDAPVLVPAQWCYVMWSEKQGASEPRVTYPALAGIAAGETLQYACMSALEEVVERDATMVWWANAQPLASVPYDGPVAEVAGAVSDRHEVALIHLENQFSLPVMAAAVRDRESNELAIGFALRHDARSAALKALLEAYMLHINFVAFQQSTPDGRASTGRLELHNLKPWRADRRYLDSYRPDFKDVVDLACQQQVYLDPAAADHVRPWTFETPSKSWDSIPSLESRSLDHYVRAVTGEGFDVIAVDLTTADVESAGFKAVRVVVPGLVSNFPAAFPFFGHDRLRLQAQALGWTEKAREESELNLFPLAHF